MANMFIWLYWWCFQFSSGRWCLGRYL